MNILAIDTATPHLSLGWLESAMDSAPTEYTVELGRAHAERALPELERFLRGRGTPNLIAVGAGPGSYTGVRVGVSLALGLARGWSATVIGVPTLEAIAATEDGLIAVTLDARRGNAYSALYRVSAGRILETRLGPEKRELETFKALLPPSAHLRSDLAPSGTALARLGLERFTRGERGVEISYL